VSAAVTTLCLLAALPAPLTDRLGHRQYRERDRAHRALAAFGSLAIPALERARSHPCPEVRERALRLLYPHAVELADRDARALATFALPEFREWRATDGWVYDLRFRWFYAAEHHSPVVTLRLWIQSQLLQRRPRAEILRTLRLLRAWRGDQ
jgi:hypothetical protein